MHYCKKLNFIIFIINIIIIFKITNYLFIDFLLLYLLISLIIIIIIIHKKKFFIEKEEEEEIAIETKSCKSALLCKDFKFYAQSFSLNNNLFMFDS